MYMSTGTTALYDVIHNDAQDGLLLQSVPGAKRRAAVGVWPPPPHSGCFLGLCTAAWW